MQSKCVQEVQAGRKLCAAVAYPHARTVAALARELSLLLLDEPFEGLAPQIVREIEATLVELKNTGLTNFLVEQNAVAALAIADRAAIIDGGQIATRGNRGESWAMPRSAASIWLSEPVR